MSTAPVLLDADALVASSVEFDLGHEKAVEIFRRLEEEKRELIILNLALYEAATVISHRLGQKIAIDFLDKVRQEHIIFLDKKLDGRAREEFRNQTKKGTSFTDCANLALAKKLGTDEIFSFDIFYRRNGLYRFGIDSLH